jgi:diacylglycerol kinase
MFRFRRLFKSFRYAVKGLVRVLREEQNIQVQTAIGTLALLAGLYFGITRTEWLFMIMAAGLVLVTETVNSAVERVADVHKPRMDAYVKEIKDIMAAAVLLASLAALATGLVIFIPYLIK